jgi:hypothetical protein
MHFFFGDLRLLVDLERFDFLHLPVDLSLTYPERHFFFGDLRLLVDLERFDFLHLPVDLSLT